MRFISLFRPTDDCPASPEQFEKMGAFITEAAQAGVLLATEGFGPSTSVDVRMVRKGGAISVTDGPFAESKEVIGGFALMRVSSREEVMAWSRRFMELAGDGECEIRLLSELSPIETLTCR